MSGGGGFSGYRSIGTSSQLSSSTSGVQASQHEIEMNEFLEDLLKAYNKRDVEAIQTHLNEIEKILGREIEDLDRILFGGSISKNTFIEGTSDVDALVILDSAKYENGLFSEYSYKRKEDFEYCMCDHEKMRYTEECSECWKRALNHPYVY